MTKRGKNVPYFANREEQAVIDYIMSDSQEVRNKIYNEILIKPFNKMIQSIIRRYPIHIGNNSIGDVESEVLNHLIDRMVKFNPNIITKFGVKTKAFSYCQTIVRNYCKDHSKKSYIDKKINIPYVDNNEEIENNKDYSYVMDLNEQQHLEQLINMVIKKIENKIEGNVNIKPNEIIVGDAIVNVLKNWHMLFLEDTPVGKYDKKITNKFAKNKILLYLKELTGMSTKEIRVAIRPFKEIYFIEKNVYYDD